MRVNLYGPINTLGYGYACLNVLKELVRHYEISLFLIGQPQLTTIEDKDLVQHCISNQANFDYMAPCLKIWHQFDMALNAGKGIFFGWPIFELDSFKSNERNHLQSCDRLIVCSDWAKNITNCIDRPCDVVPLGVDTSIFYPQQTKNQDNCVFFNCGKWEIRKGHDILLEAFQKAFPRGEKCQLWMMCDNPFLTEQETNEWENFYQKDDRVKILHRVNTHKELAQIMNLATCGVFPSRAEGWNLELLEMMALGKLCIATDYSGPTEYTNEDNCLLLNVEDMEPAYDGKWFHGEGNWASIKIESLVELMRYVYERWKKGNIYNKNGVETAQEYTWKNTANKLASVLNV